MELEDSYTDRIEALFYSKSDEKFVVRQELGEILGHKRFGKVLDVGPGQGHITEPLAARTDDLTLVEIRADYGEQLRKQFEKARIIIDSIDNVDLPQGFDLILLSHNLYYHRAEEWFPLCKRLHDALAPGGELFIIVNPDAGNWWEIINHFWDRLRPHINFDYIPISRFRKELAKLGPVRSHSYRYQLWVDPGSSFADFVGREMLEINDDQVMKQYEADFAEMEQRFRHVDGSAVLDFHGEIIRVSKQ